MSDLFSLNNIALNRQFRGEAPETLTIPDLQAATTIIVAFSGGKDSAACVLHLLDLGVEKSKIELWHHDIDGREGAAFMDWPVTKNYCRAFARALNLPIFFSWKEGGFEREMMRDNTPTAPIWYETPEGELRKVGGESNSLGTRHMFPQLGALKTRWCSAYLKIDVCSAAIRNQDRFLNTYTIVVTGERAEESTSRAKYKQLEPHRTDQRDGTRRPRKVDHWRPIHAWREQDVWEILRRHGVRPHPVYEAGFGRCSCAGCIFSNADQLRSFSLAAPEMFNKIADYEVAFGKTIHREKPVTQRIKEGKPYRAATPEALALCMAETYDLPILIDPDDWTLPAGAYGDSSGPI